MPESLWGTVEEYLSTKLLPDDPALETALNASAAAGLPPHQITPIEGRFLHLLARIQGAQSILELGTLGGYSTICLARALPADGHLITLELERHHAEVAAANIDRAGLTHLVDIRTGPALESLQRLIKESVAPFDLIFIDADKAGCPVYFDLATLLSRPGTVIIVDNVVRSGAVIDAESADESIQGVRRMLDQLTGETRIIATAIQTVGSKGHDGMLIARVGSVNDASGDPS